MALNRTRKTRARGVRLNTDKRYKPCSSCGSRDGLRITKGLEYCCICGSKIKQQEFPIVFENKLFKELKRIEDLLIIIIANDEYKPLKDRVRFLNVLGLDLLKIAELTKKPINVIKAISEVKNEKQKSR